MKKTLIMAACVLAMSMVSCGEKKTEQAAAASAEEARPVQLSEADANLQAGQDFLAENGQREGVVTTPSGLQYEIIVEGNGNKPGATDVVMVHYEGQLLDGTVFDSSYARNEPATFPLNRVISGWTEGVQLMPVGSKYRLYIPANLAYGEHGTPGGPIGPNETLIFDVELLAIQ